jgi:hypothetical protein
MLMAEQQPQETEVGRHPESIEGGVPVGEGDITTTSRIYTPSPYYDLSGISATESKFDPEPQREKMRGRIAMGLLLMVAGIVAISFISLWFGMDTDTLQTLLTIIFGPIVALAGTATGFYFGGRTGPS